jgi:hypothetical protein
MQDDLRRRAADLIRAESRYHLASTTRCFLLGLASGAAFAALAVMAS